MMEEVWSEGSFASQVPLVPTRRILAVRLKFLRVRGSLVDKKPCRLRIGGVELLRASPDGGIDYTQPVPYSTLRAFSSPRDCGSLLQQVPADVALEREQERSAGWNDPQGSGRDGAAVYLVLDRPQALSGYRIMSAPAAATGCCGTTSASDASVGRDEDPTMWQVHALYEDDVRDGLHAADAHSDFQRWPAVVRCPDGCPSGVPPHMHGRSWTLVHRQFCRFAVPRRPARWSHVMGPHESEAEEHTAEEVRTMYRKLGWLDPDQQRLRRRKGRPSGKERGDIRIPNWELRDSEDGVVWHNTNTSKSQWEFAAGTAEAEEEFMSFPGLGEENWQNERALAGWVSWMLAFTQNERLQYLPEHSEERAAAEEASSTNVSRCKGIILSAVPCSSRCACGSPDDVERWLLRPRCCGCDCWTRCYPCARLLRCMVIREEEDLFTDAYERWSRGFSYRWHDGTACSTNFFDPCPDLYQEMTCRWIDVMNKIEEGEIEVERMKLFKLLIVQVLVSLCVVVATVFTLTDPLSSQQIQYIISQFITGAVGLSCAFVGFLGVVGQNERLLRTQFILNIWLLAIFTVYLAWVLFDASEVTDVCWPNMFDYRRDQGRFECMIAQLKYGSKIMLTFGGALSAYLLALSAFSLLDALNDKTGVENDRLIFRYLETVATDRTVAWSRYKALDDRVKELEEELVSDAVAGPPASAPDGYDTPPLPDIKTPAPLPAADPAPPTPVVEAAPAPAPPPGPEPPPRPTPPLGITGWMDGRPPGPLPPPLPPALEGGWLQPVVAPGAGGVTPLMIWSDFVVEWTLTVDGRAVPGGGVRVACFDASLDFIHLGPSARSRVPRPGYKVGPPLVRDQKGRFGLYEQRWGEGMSTYVKLLPGGGGPDGSVLPPRWIHTVFYFCLPAVRPDGAEAVLQGVVRAGGSDANPIAWFKCDVGGTAPRRREGTDAVAACLLLSKLPLLDPPVTAADGSPLTRYLLWHLKPTLGGCGTDELVREGQRRLRYVERPSPPYATTPAPPAQCLVTGSFTVELWWQMREGMVGTGMDVFGTVLAGPVGMRSRVRLADGGVDAHVDGFYRNTAHRQWPPADSGQAAYSVLEHSTGDLESAVKQDQCEALTVNLDNLAVLRSAGYLEPRAEDAHFAVLFGANSTTYVDAQPGGADEDEVTWFSALEHATFVVRRHDGVVIAAHAIETREPDEMARRSNAYVAFAVRCTGGVWCLQTLGHELHVRRGERSAEQIFRAVAEQDKGWAMRSESSASW